MNTKSITINHYRYLGFCFSGIVLVCSSSIVLSMRNKTSYQKKKSYKFLEVLCIVSTSKKLHLLSTGESLKSLRRIQRELGVVQTTQRKKKKRRNRGGKRKPRRNSRKQSDTNQIDTWDGEDLNPWLYGPGYLSNRNRDNSS